MKNDRSISSLLRVGAVLILLLTYFAVENAYAEWKRIFIPSGTMNLHDVYFANKEEGWIVGKGGTILHTADGGESWERQNSGVEADLWGVEFVSPSEGWAVGGRPAVILHTTDGGKTWEQVDHPRSAKAREFTFRDIQFLNAEEGWISGSASILHTQDGGRSWDLLAEFREDLYGVFFVNPLCGWTAPNKGRGRAPKILHTTDGGRTWEEQTVPSDTLGVGDYGPRAFYFFDQDEGWAVGRLVHTILHTTDGGGTWEVRSLLETETSFGRTILSSGRIQFVSRSEGWITGSASDLSVFSHSRPYAGSVILHTTDGGGTWNMDFSILKYGVYGMHFVDASRGWVVGLEGTVLRYTAEEPSPADTTNGVEPLPPVAGNIQTYTFGSMRHPWRISGTLKEVAYDRTEGWIAPRIIPPDENLSLSAKARGGMAWSFWGDTWTSGAKSWRRKGGWWGYPRERIIDGDPTTTYEHDYVKWGGERMGMLLLDLGGAFAVHRIRWHASIRTRGGTPARGILQLTVSINDGNLDNRDGRGRPLLTPVWGGQANAGEDVDVTFPEETVRYVGVWVDATLADAFALEELEVYGRGYVPRGSYASRIIVFEDIVALGEIGWTGAKSPGAKVLIRTRSGMDEDPNVYWRKVKEGQREKLTDKREDGEPLTREDYEKLLSEDRGPITYDTDNWSFWSAPYDFEEGRKSGVSIVSPAPRQYFQIRVDFISTPSDGARIDSLWFQYSRPPCAHEIVGEIHPIEVKPAEVTTFTYAVRPRIRGEDTGFDTMEIETPVPTEEIREVRIDRVPVSFRVRTEEAFEGIFRNPHSLPAQAGAIRTPEGFVVSFRKVEVDRTLVEVVFDSQVLRYSTEFVGRVWNSEIEQVPQRIFAGDADERVASDDLAVRLPLREPLIVSVEATPDPFTPNGDGINDETKISYSLLHLTAPALVEVKVYGLSGRSVRTLYAGKDVNGNYVRVWDGRDDEGRMVPPGIYVYRICVDADAGREERMGVVNVVY